MNTSYSDPGAFGQLGSLPHRHARRVAHGFTLIELLVVLAVLTALLIISLPTFSAVVHSSKLAVASNALLSSMLLARSEAIKRSSRVTLCKTADGVSCAAAGGWEQGWMVFHDANNNGGHEMGESVIQQSEPLPHGYRFSGNQTVGRYISFGPAGTTQLTSGAFQAGTLTLCMRSTEPMQARQLVINAAGRPRIQKATVAFCA